MDRTRLQEAINLDAQIEDLKTRRSGLTLNLISLKSYLSPQVYAQIITLINNDMDSKIAQMETDFSNIPATAPAVRP